MKCKNCGHEFENGIFCPECGTKHEMENLTVAENYNSQSANINNNAIGKIKKKIPWYLNGFFIFVVFCLTIVPGIILWIIRIIKYKEKRLRVILVPIFIFAVLILVTNNGDDQTPKDENKTKEYITDSNYTESLKKPDDKIESSKNLTNQDDDSINWVNAEPLDKILNSYKSEIVIFNSDDSLEKYQHDTNIYIDGESMRAEFSSGGEIYINELLTAGTHEIWMCQTTNKKEKESNKIRFDISPAYTNCLKIEAVHKNKKFSLSIAVENNVPFEGYETEIYEDAEIVRTSNGKEAYYEVQFLIDKRNLEYASVGGEFGSFAVIDTVKVKKGDTVRPPEAPILENYRFIGWDRELTNVQSNTDIYAEYELVEEDMQEYQEYCGRYSKEDIFNENDPRDKEIDFAVTRITNLGIYFDLRYITTDILGIDKEIVYKNVFAPWFNSEVATFEMSNDEENEDPFFIRIVLFEGKINIVQEGGKIVDGLYNKIN